MSFRASLCLRKTPDGDLVVEYLGDDAATARDRRRTLLLPGEYASLENYRFQGTRRVLPTADATPKRKVKKAD